MFEGRTFVLGDVHGAHKAMLQVFQKAGFDYENDRLICLGDICDGWPDVYLCFEELLKIKHLVLLLGNHDLWGMDWMKTGSQPEIWMKQGGDATVQSYLQQPIPDAHLRLLESAKDYFLEDDRLFVHGGIIAGIPLEKQDRNILIWDRSLIQKAVELKTLNEEQNLTGYREVYLGHTPIHRLGMHRPTKVCEVWMMDTGAGWDGALSMLNLESKEAFVSDPVTDLYPDVQGRKRY